MINPNPESSQFSLTSLMVALLLGAGYLSVLTSGEMPLPSSFSITHSYEQEEADRLDQQVTKLYEQGKYAEAIPLVEQQLAISKRLYGENHPDIAANLNTLGLLYYSQGRYIEAEPLYKQSLEMSKRLHGKNHQDIATSLNNLGLVYLAQDRYSEAEPLLKQAQAIRQRLLGAGHKLTDL